MTTGAAALHWWIWGSALLAYALFRAWYDNWRGPLRREEIDACLAKLRGTPSAEHNDIEVLRTFLENDDGREFVMLNLVRFNPAEAAHPQTAVMTPGLELMQVYMKTFVRALIRRGGHPAIVSRKIGGYVDAWGVEPDPGWSILGTMRYRSRRDLAEMIADPRFLELHPFKIAGTAETLSFPTRPILMLFVSPRVWVGLLLAFIASLVQIAALLAR